MKNPSATKLNSTGNRGCMRSMGSYRVNTQRPWKRVLVRSRLIVRGKSQANRRRLMTSTRDVSH